MGIVRHSRCAAIDWLTIRPITPHADRRSIFANRLTATEPPLDLSCRQTNRLVTPILTPRHAGYAHWR